MVDFTLTWLDWEWSRFMDTAVDLMIAFCGGWKCSGSPERAVSTP